MRVLYFTRDYTPHDHRFLSALAHSEHDVYALRLERRGQSLEERPLPGGITSLTWAGGQKPLSLTQAPMLVRALRSVLTDLKPDVVHAGSIQTAALFTALAGYQPLVSMSWGSDLLLDTRQSLWMNLAARYTLNHTTVMVGDCDAVRRKAQSFGFPGERVVLFPWGVDLEHFSPSASDVRVELGWEDNVFIILSLRTWEPLYGVDVVARAFVRAAQIEPDLRLVLLGSGSQETLIRSILETGGVLDKVHFGGRVGYAGLPGHYNAADLYVSASHSDGSSVSLMEALACGTPALISDIPGNLEWITPAKQGWFFPDGDDRTLAHGMVEAYRQRAHLGEMRQAARALAEQRADWKTNFQKLLTAYDLAKRLTSAK